MKKTVLGLGVLALTLGAIGVSVGMASAYRGDPAAHGPNYSVERHEAMTKAFENNDYNAWKNLMQGRGGATRVVNEGNFARFSEMHRLESEGKTDEARKIRQELGLGSHDGSGHGANGAGRGRHMNR